jgi:2-polyprenyl-3-methyl-5-hydroxy-6-metoxy-1,4-benzoquinol methylase
VSSLDVNGAARSAVGDLTLLCRVSEREFHRMLSKIHADRVLDAACGDGAFTEVLIENLGSFRQILGCDTDKDSIDTARRYIENMAVRFSLRSVYEMTYQEGSFSVVSVSNGLHHFPEPGKAVQALWKVLSPGGFLCVQEPFQNPANPAEPAHNTGAELTGTEKTGLAFHHLKSRIDRERGMYHRETYTPGEIFDVLGTVPVRYLESFVLEAGSPDSAGGVRERVRFLRQYLKLVQDNPAYPEIRRECDRVIGLLEREGFSRQPSLVVIGEKLGHE